MTAVFPFAPTDHGGARKYEAYLWRAPDSDVERTLVIYSEDGRPTHLKGEYVRDEVEQATYLRELLEIFESEGVDAAFVYTFARYDLPHRTDPHLDLDTASAGVVKVLERRRGDRYPDVPWEPKAAFEALADYYSRSSSRTARVHPNGPTV